MNRSKAPKLVTNDGQPLASKHATLLGTVFGPVRFSTPQTPHKGRGTSPDRAYTDWEVDLLINGKPSGFVLKAAIWTKIKRDKYRKKAYKIEDPGFFAEKFFQLDDSDASLEEQARGLKREMLAYVGAEYGKAKDGGLIPDEQATPTVKIGAKPGRRVEEIDLPDEAEPEAFV